MNSCPTCSTPIPTDKCYHRCANCAQPFYDFDDKGIWRCQHCDEPFIYSWSLVDAFNSCPKYFMFSVELGYSTTSINMHFGTAVHRGLDSLAKTGDLETAITEALLKFSEWEGEGNDLHTPEKVEGILRSFHARYHDNILITGEGMNEVSGAMDLFGAMYSGKVDRVITAPSFNIEGREGETPIDLTLNTPCVVDWKTTSFFDRQPFHNTYRLSGQFVGYAILASHYFNLDISHAVVMLIKVSKGTKTRTKTQIADGRFPYDDAYDFLPIPLEFPLWRKEKFMKDVWRTVDEINVCRRMNHYPERHSYCWHYNRICEYAAYCMIPLEDAIPQLPLEFNLRSWDSIAGKETILKHREEMVVG